MSNPPPCVTCRWFRRATYPYCESPKALTVFDLVYGDVKVNKGAAYFMRRDPKDCGPEGKHWEPKKGKIYPWVRDKLYQP